MTKETVLIILLGVIIIGLRVYFVYVNQVVQDESKTYQQIVDETDKYKKENSILREEVLSKEALVTIDQEARDKGMVDAQFIVLK